MKRKRGLPKEIKSWIVIAFLFNLLPATKAQTSLSTDSTDFNGAIPPSCVVDIPESSYPMSYNSTDNRNVLFEQGLIDESEIAGLIMQAKKLLNVDLKSQTKGQQNHLSTISNPPQLKP